MQKIRFFGVEGYHAVDYQKRKLVSLGRRSGADGQVTITENPVEIKMQDPLGRGDPRLHPGRVPAGRRRRCPGEDGRAALELALRINDAIEKNRARAPLDSAMPVPPPAVSFPGGSPAGDRMQP